MQRSNRWQRGTHDLGKRPLRYGLLVLLAIATVVLGLGRSPAMAETARHYTEIEFPPLRPVEIPEYTVYELDNGLQVYLIEDHELPIVSGTALIRTGDRWEPADKVGLAGITGEVMRSGGTVNHPADELNQMLEQRAAFVETSIDTVSGTANFSTLTEDLPEVFSLFAEVLRQPAFPQDKIDLAITQREGAIARRNDSPDGVTSREFRKLVYGASSPYARTTEYSTLAAISRQDVVDFHQQYFHPNTMLLGIVGDFEPEEMRSRIEQAFGDWEPALADQVAWELPEVSQANRGMFMVNQPQLNQSYIQIGHLGGQLDSPDHAPLSVLNEVMNGFGGRLVNEVRSRQGLAYVVYAFWSPRFDYPGLFIGGGQTQSPTTVPFIQSMLSELKRVRTTPISEEELARAKDSVLNAFVFNFTAPGQTLQRLLRYAYYGYPEDFIFQYQQQVTETTQEDILRVAQTHLKPEDLIMLVVGNEAEIDPALSTLVPDTEVTRIDISIPPPV
jgi:zinc protease